MSTRYALQSIRFKTSGPEWKLTQSPAIVISDLELCLEVVKPLSESERKFQVLAFGCLKIGHLTKDVNHQAIDLEISGKDSQGRFSLRVKPTDTTPFSLLVQAFTGSKNSILPDLINFPLNSAEPPVLFTVQFRGTSQPYAMERISYELATDSKNIWKISDRLSITKIHGVTCTVDFDNNTAKKELKLSGEAKLRSSGEKIVILRVSVVCSGEGDLEIKILSSPDETISASWLVKQFAMGKADLRAPPIKGFPERLKKFGEEVADNSVFVFQKNNAKYNLKKLRIETILSNDVKWHIFNLPSGRFTVSPVYAKVNFKNPLYARTEAVKASFGGFTTIGDVPVRLDVSLGSDGETLHGVVTSIDKGKSLSPGLLASAGLCPSGIGDSLPSSAPIDLGGSGANLNITMVPLKDATGKSKMYRLVEVAAHLGPMKDTWTFIPNLFEIMNIEVDLKTAPPRDVGEPEIPDDPKKPKSRPLVITGTVTLENTKLNVKNSDSEPCFIAQLGTTELKNWGYLKFIQVITGGAWNLSKDRFLKVIKPKEVLLRLYWHPNPSVTVNIVFEDWKYETSAISVIHKVEQELHISCGSKNNITVEGGLIKGEAELNGMGFTTIPVSYKSPEGQLQLMQGGSSMSEAIKYLSKFAKDHKKIVFLIQQLYGENANSLVRNQLAHDIVTALVSTGAIRTEVVSIVNDVFKTKIT
eukprot:TRINITY_DN3425_c0_g2_i1.p1 TRINITY_DN3425_c0_g2~~TRINITY_DN3425_c0_g2_i1.p1  ORF type:complete len:808 (-),score=145.79 TRINITY_DN3425_c0_g2_i1:35-2131(-)